MFSLNVAFRWCALVLVAGTLCGCLPSSQNPLDEQKEMHFLTGKARENAMDYQGAIEAFERALEANPKNGSAHFELGLLYEREKDFSAAIYHFERYLKLRPNSDYSQIVKEKISADKIELSKTAAFAPVTQTLQREFDKLAEENKALRAEVEKWKAEAEQWRAHFTSQAQAGNPAPQTVRAAQSEPQQTVASYASPTRPALRTHTVKPGDTLSSIARLYSVRLDALQAVNPRVDPRKMRVGDQINVPAN